MTQGPPTNDATVRRTFPWAGVWTVGLALIFLVQVGLINRRIDRGHSGDFRHFYYAARALLDGEDLYTSGTGGYLYPPLIAVLYTPVARLSYTAAQRVMLVVDAGLIVSGLLLAGRAILDRFAVPRSRAVWLGVAVLACLGDIDKVHNELQMFQTNALQLALFALALFWLDRRPTLAGVPLGAILNIKYLSLAMVPWLLIRRRWSTAVSTLASGLLFALLPAVPLMCHALVHGVPDAAVATRSPTTASTAPASTAPAVETVDVQALPPRTVTPGEAVVYGWNQNLHYLSVAYGGLATMVGAGSGTAGPTEQANVEDITNLLSCSLTSAMARMAKFHDLPLSAGLAAAGGIAVVVVGAVLLMYRRWRVPPFAWPTAGRQREQPWRAVIGMEFVAVLMGTLMFSPQTNSRHLCLATLLTTVAAALLVAGRPRVDRWPIAIAAAVMFLTFVLPPGNRYTEAHHWADLWFGVGGPCWGMLVLVLVVVEGALEQARATAGSADPGRR
jgi:hypothetical protein